VGLNRVQLIEIMSEFQLVHFPGFQRGHETTTYDLQCSRCLRTVTDESKRRPISFRSICSDQVALGNLTGILDQVDWDEMKSEAGKIFVDDVDQNVVSGKFGKVSLPLSYLLNCQEDFSPTFQRGCIALADVFRSLETLVYREVSE
jgi:hypothetical protein